MEELTCLREDLKAAENDLQDALDNVLEHERWIVRLKTEIEKIEARCDC